MAYFLIIIMFVAVGIGINAFRRRRQHLNDTIIEPRWIRLSRAKLCNCGAIYDYSDHRNCPSCGSEQTFFITNHLRPLRKEWRGGKNGLCND